MNHEPGALRIAGELDVLVHPNSLLHVVQNLLRGRFVTHDEIAGAPLLHDSQRLVVQVAAGIAAPRDPEWLEPTRDLPGALSFEAEGVVVEEELLDRTEVVPCPGHLRDDVVDRALAVPMTTRGLWPQAEGALGRTSARRENRSVGPVHPRDVVLSDVEVSLID